jgi:Prp8 binding protein
LRGHTDTPTSLALSPNGSYLLSVGNDSTARIWDVRPFAPVTNAMYPGQNPRLYRTLAGAPAGYENWLRKGAWDGSGERIAMGGADRTVDIFEVRMIRNV